MRSYQSTLYEYYTKYKCILKYDTIYLISRVPGTQCLSMAGVLGWEHRLDAGAVGPRSLCCMFTSLLVSYDRFSMWRLGESVFWQVSSLLE